MIKLKQILFEKDEKPDSENPDKILVKNKESGESYYISKDSFDPSKHEKTQSKEKKKPKKEDDGTENPLDAAFAGMEKKEKKSTEKTSGNEKGGEEEKPKEPKKLSAKEKLEKKLGSYVFLDDKEKEEIASDAQVLRPDLKKRLLKFEFTSFFRDYDTLLDTLEIQNKNKDTGGSKETVVSIRKIAKRIQGIAIAKLAAVAPKSNDPKSINAAKFYHLNSDKINKILRGGGSKMLSSDEIEEIRRKRKEAEEKGYFINFEYTDEELNVMESINDMDEHFKSDGARLEEDTVVFRGVLPDILKQFVDAGEWIDNGFVSTSLNPLIAENFTAKTFKIGDITGKVNPQKNPAIFRIELKRGTKVLALPCAEDEFCVETELTLQRGTRFKITGYDTKKNIYNVTVETPNA